MTSSNGRKSIFITGAASGMGRATALLFAEKGWFVGAYDVNQAGLETLQEEVGDANGLFEILDVTDALAWKSAMDLFAIATGGALDLLFNNAGIGASGLLDEQPWDDVMRIVNINFIGVMLGVRTGVPLLKNTPGSLCLITSSSSAIFGTAGIPVYSATKHAVRGLTEALSIELKRYGVRAADLLPGLIDTPLLSDGMRQMAPSEGMWRLVKPREVAETVWEAYGANRVHWYIPEELREFHLQVVAEPEKVREERTALLAAMTAAG
ncbi:SDR family oxidoreductase [Sphingomonas sp. TREG-RG-20F-R18-01]|uniref:SDR family oxidoreductase n=1 Tax=Sphingomonas sp. TREG-RG-20F-R18-01 TaxID=2914982 RepID=UPI001F584745|nr:SDR family oxidoreductase [Sphingomonas sp. TREG-RG-20F-R18-01]